MRSTLIDGDIIEHCSTTINESVYHDCPNLMPRSNAIHDPPQVRRRRLFIIFNYSWKRRRGSGVCLLRVIGVLTRNEAIKLIDKLQTFSVYRAFEIHFDLRFAFDPRFVSAISCFSSECSLHALTGDRLSPANSCPEK